MRVEEDKMSACSVRLIILFISFFIFSSAFAQEKSFRAGLIVGLTTSQVDGDQLVGFNKAGIKAGAFVKRMFGEKLFIQFELEYIQKGSRRPLNPDDNSFYLMRVNYAEAPFMLGYFLSKKWNVEAGVSVAALVSSHEEDETKVITGAPPFNKIDYLANAGVNYFMSEQFFANVRFSYSIVPMRTLYPGYDYYYTGKQYNKVLAFTLGYLF